MKKSYVARSDYQWMYLLKNNLEGDFARFGTLVFQFDFHGCEHPNFIKLPRFGLSESYCTNFQLLLAASTSARFCLRKFRTIDWVPPSNPIRYKFTVVAWVFSLGGPEWDPKTS